MSTLNWLVLFSFDTTLYADFDKIFIFFLLSDHVLLGHAMDTVTVVDEFECQLKCIENKSCKSVNVHPDGNNAQRRICELNNETRQRKPRDFKWRKGSTYYGSVQVSWKLPHIHIFYFS